MNEPGRSAAKLLTVGEVALRSGIAVSAVHFYERRGLIAAWRSRGNQRRYERAVLRRIAIIKVAQQLGVPLAEIGERLAALPADRTPGRADWARTVAAKAWAVPASMDSMAAWARCRTLSGTSWPSDSSTNSSRA